MVLQGLLVIIRLESTVKKIRRMRKQNKDFFNEHLMFTYRCIENLKFIFFVLGINQKLYNPQQITCLWKVK